MSHPFRAFARRLIKAVMPETATMHLSRTLHGHRVNTTATPSQCNIQIETETKELFNITLLIASKSGLYFFHQGKLEKWLTGRFYGITERQGRWYVYSFDTSTYGRLLSFQILNNTLSDLREELRAIPPEIHQIDWLGDALLTTDTSNNRLTSYEFRNGKLTRPRHYYPAGRLKNGRQSDNYRHINSVYCDNTRIFVVCHNDTRRTGRPSEIMILNHAFQVQTTIVLEGGCAHNVIPFRDSFIYCDSLGGAVDLAGTKIAVGNFPRGVAMNNDSVLVGTSEFANRDNRDFTNSRIHVICIHRKRILGELTIPQMGSIYEIRLVNPDDSGLSAYIT